MSLKTQRPLKPTMLTVLQQLLKAKALSLETDSFELLVDSASSSNTNHEQFELQNSKIEKKLEF